MSGHISTEIMIYTITLILAFIDVLKISSVFKFKIKFQISNTAVQKSNFIFFTYVKLKLNMFLRAQKTPCQSLLEVKLLSYRETKQKNKNKTKQESL